MGHPGFKGLTDAAPDNRPLAEYPRDGLTRQISRLILPLNVSSSPASIASAHTDMLGTGGLVVTDLNVLLLITDPSCQRPGGCGIDRHHNCWRGRRSKAETAERACYVCRPATRSSAGGDR